MTFKLFPKQKFHEIILRDGGWAGHGDPQSSCAFTFLFTLCHGSFYVHSKFVISESSIRAQRLGTVVLRVDFVFVFPVSPETGSLQNRVDDLVLILSSTSRNKCDEYVSMFLSLQHFSVHHHQES